MKNHHIQDTRPLIFITHQPEDSYSPIHTYTHSLAHTEGERGKEEEKEVAVTIESFSKLF